MYAASSSIYGPRAIGLFFKAPPGFFPRFIVKSGDWALFLKLPPAGGDSYLLEAPTTIGSRSNATAFFPPDRRSACCEPLSTFSVTKSRSPLVMGIPVSPDLVFVTVPSKLPERPTRLFLRAVFEASSVAKSG
jgi:hypothetical protein